MCKKNNPGCRCCCSPITERDDSFPSLWKCYKGKLKYAIGTPDGFEDLQFWYVDSGTGQLVYSKTSTTSSGVELFPICVDAQRLSLPFYMEMEVDVAELNTVSGSQAFLRANMAERVQLAGLVRELGGEFIIGAYSSSLWSATLFIPPSGFQTTSFGPQTPPFTVKHRVFFETNGLTQWLWINGTLATVTSGPAWGTKLTGSVSSMPFFPNAHRTWQMWLPATTAIRTDWAKFDRWYVHEYT